MTAGLLVLHSVNKRITPASKSSSLATHLNMSSRKLGFAFRGFTWAKFSRSNFWVSLMFRGAIFTLGSFEEPSSNKTKLCVFLQPCCQWVLFWLAFQTCLIVLVVELHTLIDFCCPQLLTIVALMVMSATVMMLMIIMYYGNDGDDNYVSIWRWYFNLFTSSPPPLPHIECTFAQHTKGVVSKKNKKK